MNERNKTVKFFSHCSVRILRTGGGRILWAALCRTAAIQFIGRKDAAGPAKIHGQVEATLQFFDQAGKSSFRRCKPEVIKVVNLRPPSTHPVSTDDGPGYAVVDERGEVLLKVHFYHFFIGPNEVKSDSVLFICMPRKIS